MREVSLTILGQAPRKSNSRQIVSRGRGGRPMLIKSKEALAYERSFVFQVANSKKLALGSKDKPLLVDMLIFYKDKFRADLSNELVLDCLTKAGVIKDDRYLVDNHLRKKWSKENPRVEMVVLELNEWDWEGG